MADVGLSFSATGQGGNNNGYQGTRSPTQDAIRILSFRQPTVLGSSAPVAPSLFGGQQGGAMPGGMTPEMLLRMLFGLQNQGGGAMSGPPMPNIQGQSAPPIGNASLPASFTFENGDKQVPPPDTMPMMPPSPTNPVTGNQFVNFDQPQERDRRY